MAYEPKLTAGLRLYKNGSVAASVSDKSSVTSLTASGLTNGTEYTFTATHYDSTGQVKEGPKSSEVIVKAWSTTTTYNVTFPALQKGYGVAQQTWTYYNNMGVKSTRVATISGSGYSGDTKAATIAVRSGLTVAITDTKYYSNIANYVEPSQYMGSSGKETSWTITSAKTVNQMFTQWKVSPLTTVTDIKTRQATVSIKNQTSTPFQFSFRFAAYGDEIRDFDFTTTSSTYTTSSYKFYHYEMAPQTKYYVQSSYYSSTYNLIDRDSATIVTFTTATPSYVAVIIPAKTTYAQNVVYKYYGVSATQSTYTQTSTSTKTITVETNSTITATCNPTSTYLDSVTATTNVGTSNTTLPAMKPRFKTPTLKSLTNAPDDTILILNYQSPVGCYMD